VAVPDLGQHTAGDSTGLSNHRLPVAENILDRNFSPEGQNESWCADITYIPTG
jgi:putative transposase